MLINTLIQCDYSVIKIDIICISTEKEIFIYVCVYVVMGEI